MVLLETFEEEVLALAARSRRHGSGANKWRLKALRKEGETGQAELQRVEAQRAYLHEMILRISGGVQFSARTAGSREVRWERQSRHRRKALCHHSSRWGQRLASRD
jgi:hypothetical protein